MKRVLPVLVGIVVVLFGLLAWKGRAWGLFGSSGDADGPSAGPAPEEVAGRGTLKGRAAIGPLGPDPRTWEGDPVGVLELTLGKAAVSGKVLGDGAALRFARVSPVLPPPDDGRAVRTTKDGTFEVRGLYAGVVDLRVSAEGFRSRTVTTAALIEGKTLDLGEIVLKPVPPMKDGLEVKVVDGGGKPVAGARVAATTVSFALYLAMPLSRSGIPGAIVHEETTDEHGVARIFPLPPEKYDVSVRAKGFALDAAPNVVVAAGRVEKVKIVLSPAMTLSGTIVDLDGAPVADAFVNGMLMPAFRGFETVKSDAKGHFSLEGLVAGQYILFAGSDAKGEGQGGGTAGETGARIQLKGAGRVEGHVKRADGTPVTRFALRPYRSGPFIYVYSQRIEVADPDGRFSISLAPGSYTVDAQGDGGEFKGGSSVAVVAGATQSLEIVLPALSVAKGVVTDPDGDALKDAEVYVSVGGFPPSPHREWYARTDAEGRFAIKGLPIEPTKLHVRHAGFAPAVVDAVPAAPEAAAEITVRLLAGARVQGRVTTAGGAPVPGMQVNLYQSLDFLRARTAFTDEAGSYAFSAVAAGAYNVSLGRFEANAAGQQKSNVPVPETGVAVVDFQTLGDETIGKVVGRVTVAGVPAKDVTVQAWDDRGVEAAVTTTTDAEGRYEVGGLKPGRITVMIQTTGGITTTKSGRISKPEEPATVDVVLGSASVKGTLLGPDGRVTVSNAWVTLETPELGRGNDVWSGMKGNTRPSDTGEFAWTGLDPGRYRVRVIAEQFAARLTEPFTVGEGESKDLGAIRLEAGGGLRGRVTDDRGTPLENVGIALNDRDGRSVFLLSFASTGSDGRYALQGIALGDYTARFDAKGYASVEKAVKVDQAGTTVDVVLPRGGSIAVTVVDEQEKPLAGTRIELLDSSGAKVAKTLTIVNLFDSDALRANALGVVTIPDLAPGAYTVRPAGEAYDVEGAVPVITVASGSTSATKLVLKPKP